MTPALIEDQVITVDTDTTTTTTFHTHTTRTYRRLMSSSQAHATHVFARLQESLEPAVVLYPKAPKLLMVSESDSAAHTLSSAQDVTMVFIFSRTASYKFIDILSVNYSC